MELVRNGSYYYYTIREGVKSRGVTETDNSPLTVSLTTSAELPNTVKTRPLSCFTGHKSTPKRSLIPFRYILLLLKTSVMILSVSSKPQRSRETISRSHLSTKGEVHCLQVLVFSYYRTKENL